jgi:DNA-binding MurR/RpiR family transcriptional regulator
MLAAEIRDNLEGFTRTERRVALALLDDYPLAGLKPITQLAHGAGVSPQTVLRFLAKLGVANYGGFQDRLRSELASELQSPLARWRVQRRGEDGKGRFLSAFSERVVANIEDTVRQLSDEEFEAACRLVADPANSIVIIGGRFTGAVASYLSAHLQVMRPKVELVHWQTLAWPDRLLDIGRRSVLLVFDIRRYQPDIIRFSQTAGRRGAKAVLFSDSWGSAAARSATHVLCGRIETGHGWDSIAAILVLVEGLIARVSDLLGPDFAQRMEDLERLRDQWPSDADGNGR